MKPKTPKTKTKAEKALEKALDGMNLGRKLAIRRAVKEAVHEAEVRHLHCGLVKQTTALVNLADAVERMDATVAKFAAKPRRRAGGKK